MPPRRRPPGLTNERLEQLMRGTATPPTPLTPAEDPSLYERMGGLRGLLAGGTRAISGVLSAPGFGVGAAISGAGETLAQGIEGTLFDPEVEATRKLARIGTEATIGAIPFGAVLKAGRPIASGIRGALYSGAGEAGREWARGEEFDDGAIAGQAALGGALTGGLARLFRGGKPSAAPPANVPKPEDLGVSRLTGVSKRTGQPVEAFRGVERGAEPPRSKEPSMGAVEGLIAKALDRLKNSPAATRGAIDDLDKGIQSAGKTGLSIRNSITDDMVAEARAHGQAERLLTAEEKAAQKLRDEQVAQQKANDILASGATPVDSLSETSVPLKVPGGTRRVRTRYVKAAEEGGDAGTGGGGTPGRSLEQLLSTEGPAPTGGISLNLRNALLGIEDAATPGNLERVGSDLTSSVQGGARVAGVSAEDPNDLAQLFKTPVGATGRNYRLAKQAEEAGEIPTSEFARNAHKLEQGKLENPYQELDNWLGRKNDPPWEMVGREQKPGAPAPVAPTPEPELPPTGGDWVAEQNALIDKFHGEGGSASQDLLHSIGMGAVGAAIGGAIDPFDNRWESALAGGAVGAAVPQLIRRYAERLQPGPPAAPGMPPTPAAASLPPDVAETVAAASTPQGFQDIAKMFWETAPHVMRSNLLLSPNLASNAIIAPWGAGILTGLERWASGDPRGLALLREMTPAKFQERMPQAMAQAKTLIGESERAGGETVMEAPNAIRKFIAYPGAFITSGDVNTRMAMLKVGFTEEEARAATLTKEPWSKWGKATVNFQRSGPLGQMLLPFGKTLVNVMEEGGKAIPGVGELVQAQRVAAGGVPDALRTRMTQQGIGAGVGVGAGVVGYNEPETPLAGRMLRGAVTNAGGPYSLLASMGYATGKALKQGKGVRGAVRTAAATPFTEMPLPSTELPMSYVNYLTAEPGEGSLPSGLVPGMGKPLMQLLGLMPEDRVPLRRPSTLNRRPRRD